MRPGTQCVNEFNETQFSANNDCNQDLAGSTRRHSGTTLPIQHSTFLRPHNQDEFHDLKNVSSRLLSKCYFYPAAISARPGEPFQNEKNVVEHTNKERNVIGSNRVSPQTLFELTRLKVTID